MAKIFIKDMEYIFWNSNWISRAKKQIYMRWNSLDGIYSRSDIAEEKISELADRIEIIQNETQKQNSAYIGELQDNFKWSNTYEQQSPK